MLVSGGGGPGNNAVYTYSWTLDGELYTLNSNSTPTNLVDLGPGVYQVTVTDQENCSVTEQITLTEPTALGLSGILSDYNGFGVSSSGASDGFINLSLTGGSAGYTYQWSTADGTIPSGQTALEDLSGLVAGTYDVLVTDSNGCTIADSFQITEPAVFVIVETILSHVDVLCYGDSTGALGASISGGAPPYDFELSDDATSVNIDSVTDTLGLTYGYTGLPAGSYTITATDANNNSQSITIVITEPASPISLTLTSSDYNGFNITCFGADDGWISILPSGGGGTENINNYTIQWTLNGQPYSLNENSTTIDLVGLGPGLYSVLVTDEVGCEYSESYLIVSPSELIINIDSEVDILCFSDLTGSIDITPVGGSGGYTYIWTLDGDPFDVVEDIANLGIGEYVVLVTDSNGCYKSEVFYITQPEPIEITLTAKVDILCFGDFTGSIDVSITGGVSPYTFLWTGTNGYSGATEDIENLEAGIYDLVATDNNNCEMTFQVELFQPEDLVINYLSTNETCTDANDGSILLDIQGGVPDYQIFWSNFGNGIEQTNLEPGSYTVTVIDGNNCEEIVTIEIIEAPIFEISPVVNDISCFGEQDGSIQLNINGGITPVSVLWDDDASAGEDRFNLGPGIYTVTITDSSLFTCEIQQSFVIVEPTALVTSGVVTNALDCLIVSSGAIDLQVTGGTPPYTFDWNNGADTEDLADIPPGNYAVTVTDSNGCSFIDEFVVTRPTEITAELDISFSADCDNHIPFQTTTISIEGGVPPYNIIWSSGTVSGDEGEIMTTSLNGTVIVKVVDSLGCSLDLTFDVDLFDLGYPDFTYDSFALTNCNVLSIDDPIQFTNTASGDYVSVDWDFGDGTLPVFDQENPIHSYTSVGTYFVTQTVHYPYGCSYEIIRELEVTKGYELVVPNAFTPNADGINDTIRPLVNCIDTVEMSIYDTWGGLIYFETSDDDLYGWDGTIDGKPAENGNYIIVVRATTFQGKLIEFNGPITLLK